MSSPLDISLTDNGINQLFIYDKAISINSNEDKILLTFSIDNDCHIFKLDKHQSEHLLNILTQHINCISYNAGNKQTKSDSQHNKGEQE